MSRYLVIPYKHVGGTAMPGNPQQASKLEVARKAMASLAERFPAVALYSVTVDEATGALSEPTLLDSVGDVPDASFHSIFSSP
jgi:hypothetical protein